MTNLGDFWRHGFEKLKAAYSEEEAKTLCMLLLCDTLNVSKSHILTNHPYPFTETLLADLEAKLQRLLKYEPIQYVIGHTWFHDLCLYIQPGALIPRPETEELVSIIAEKHPTGMSTMLDLCSGSGCIALALQHFYPNAEVQGAELSSEALSLAKRNAEQLKLPVHFFTLDVLDTPWILPSLQYDLIVSNPPYVLEKEKENMEPNVLEYEPHLALFVDDADPAIFYRTILRQALPILRSSGWLYFEASPTLVEAIKGAMRWEGYIETEIITDFRGMQRFVRGRKP